MTYPYICYMDSSDKRKPISRVKSTPNLSKEVGKLPPQSIDVEQVVLGATMLEKDAVNDTIDILNRDSFMIPNTNIYSMLYWNFLRIQNPLTCNGNLKASKNGELEAAGGALYISSLTNRVASSPIFSIMQELFLKNSLKES